jgi:hypothetical protein
MKRVFHISLVIIVKFVILTILAIIINLFINTDLLTIYINLYCIHITLLILHTDYYRHMKGISHAAQNGALF